MPVLLGQRSRIDGFRQKGEGHGGAQPPPLIRAAKAPSSNELAQTPAIRIYAVGAAMLTDL